MAIEYGFVLAIGAALAHMVWYFVEYGYLRQPFFYEPSGTWMDWFSLSYYAHNKGAYDVEQTIYPPLSFVLMKVLGISQCYANNASEMARACDWLGSVGLCGFYLLSVILTFLHFRKVDRSTYIPRSIALAFGLPLVYAFERGNLVFIAYSFYLLAFGPLLRSARLRWLAAGIVINLKVYLVAAILAPLARRRWMAVEGALIATIGVYLLSWMILGEGSPIQILRNLVGYSSGFGAQRLLDVWYASSLVPIRTLMQSEFPLYSAFSSKQVEAIYLSATMLTFITQGLAVAAVAATFLRPEVVSNHRVILFGAIVALSTKEAGGYTQVFLLVSIFMESWRGWARPIAIILGYSLCIPDDIIIPAGMPPIVRDSFLSGQEVSAQYGIGAIALLRPIIMFMACNCLAVATLLDVWKDIRSQGWKERWRYRRDWPLLPFQKRPQKPSSVSKVSM
ncbi:DUF2029 domain-containing protein [Sphingobium sp. BYY-5]|uniref:glycosyltransferase family 87 protein n=1 Tax=Sphingobium sp. BYY-5 TaxID=2926400 RepID=UPI001FA7F9CB|nr:glycosyltransferase family 87 protein [Sphingobium sp. BYY-5]MCI4590454.1 DUF2029 domain-containing protein [Sphingobium sp. BYY-5]